MVDNTLKLSFLENGIDQVALVVESVDKAVEEYWNTLGVGPWAIFTFSKPVLKHAIYRGEEVDYSHRVAFGQMGGLRIELIETIQGPTIYEDFARENGYGMHHIGVLVDDMEAAQAEAKAAGFQVIQEGYGFGISGDGHYAYLDTDKVMGMVVELIHVPSKRGAPESIYPAPAE